MIEEAMNKNHSRCRFELGTVDMMPRQDAGVGKKIVRNKSTAINWITRISYCSLIAIFFVSFPINAQQSKMPRIGYLSSLSFADDASAIESFNRGLRSVGQFEGKNVVIEYRFAQRDFRRLLALAAELVGRKVDLIVTPSPTPTRVARAATSTIPIVMAQDTDPVANGFVASLTRPGGNITGLSSFPPAINAKQLNLLKEILPKLSRVGVLANTINPSDERALKETEAAARQMGTQIEILDLRGSNELATFFKEGITRYDALLVRQSPVTFLRRRQIAAMALKRRMPAIFPGTEFVEAGGLMGYGVDVNDLFRQAATYVDKILNGAKAAQLPVGQPTKFDLVINLKTAKEIGVTIPRNLIARADRLIR
jgi:ABC-type uncharacterized transport system substrate-binding protein